MNYLAPRQGLFAMIILVSIVLHLLFFVLGQEHRLTQQYQHAIDREVAFLAEELAIPLNNADSVGMSVIAGRYIKSDNVEFIGVYNSKGQLLVPVGQDTKQGVVSESTITLNDKVLGKATIYAPAVSRAKIISDNWIFLMGVLVLYVLIFLIYGYMAHPTKELEQRIAQNVRTQLLKSGVQLYDNVPTTPQFETIQIKSSTASPPPEPLADHRTPSSPYPLDLTDSCVRVVQIRFEDLNNLLDTVDYHHQTTYFTLCDQLLVRAVKNLLNLPILTGVHLVQIEKYSSQGAKVMLRADNDQAKVAVASVLLSKLMMMLNQIVYNKHRELKRFALLIRTTISSVDNQAKVLGISKKHRESPLILLPLDDLAQIAQYAELDKLSDVTTVDERECRCLRAIKPIMIERLEAVRDATLLQE